MGIKVVSIKFYFFEKKEPKKSLQKKSPKKGTEKKAPLERFFYQKFFEILGLQRCPFGQI